MVWSISFLIFSIALIGGNALTCHNCWYNSPEVGKKLLYDKLQATPRFCENHNYCEGIHFFHPFFKKNYFKENGAFKDLMEQIFHSFVQIIHH
jgi:hypothetical protein